MYNDVGAVLNGAHEVWRRERAVNDKREIVGMGNLCDCLNIRNLGVGIAKCFYIQCFCVLLNCFLEIRDIERVHKGCRNTVVCQGMCEQIIGAAVNVFCRNDMSAVLRQILNRVGHGCRP